LFLTLIFLLQKVSANAGIFRSGLFFNPLPWSPYFFYLQNFTMALNGKFGSEILAVSWSLAIEEQFYAFFPFVVRKSSLKHLPLNLLALFSIPILLRTFIGQGFAGFVLMPWRLDSLMVGALLAIIYRTPRIWGVLISQKKWFYLLFFLESIYFLSIIYFEGFGALGHYLFLACFYGLLILITLMTASGIWHKFLNKRILVFLGSISYGVYLFHQLVNGVLHDLFFGTQNGIMTPGDIALTSIAFLLTIGIAAISFKFLEKPIIDFGHRYKYEKPH
jgi:peptidoglycan/LPS O-acetylase OafA/YrhL